MNVPPLPRPTGGRFFEAYTRGLTTTDLERLFTRDAPEAYRFFSRNVDFDELKDRPWHLRLLGRRVGEVAHCARFGLFERCIRVFGTPQRRDRAVLRPLGPRELRVGRINGSG